MTVRKKKIQSRSGSILPRNQMERLTELKIVTGNYPLKDVYNMDESGLPYRMGPQKSYLVL